jgi:hypothetical protein
VLSSKALLRDPQRSRRPAAAVAVDDEAPAPVSGHVRSRLRRLLLLANSRNSPRRKAGNPDENDQETVRVAEVKAGVEATGVVTDVRRSTMR